MLYTHKCVQCSTPYNSFCFEYLDYTVEGWETRQRQLDSGLCVWCFGEVPEAGDYKKDEARIAYHKDCKHGRNAPCPKAVGEILTSQVIT